VQATEISTIDFSISQATGRIFEEEHFFQVNAKHSDTADVRSIVGTRRLALHLCTAIRVPTPPLFSNSMRRHGYKSCSIEGMIIALGIAGLSFASAALLITELRKAPEGFEDHTGFHALRGTAPSGASNFETACTGAVTVQRKSSLGELALQYPVEHTAAG